jgi:hypothetical protein
MVEPAMVWVKSTFCADNACLETAAVESDVAVRDGKNVEKPFLRFSRTDWNAFVENVAAGEYRTL